MRKFAIAIMVVMLAAAAQAGVIADIQQGVYNEGDQVEVIGAISMGVTYNGAFITELPVGPYSGIWVYLGSGHTVVDGDVVNVQGVYEEYYDLSEINAGDGAYAVTDNVPMPAPFSLTGAEYAVDPEVFEGVAICITDGFMVTGEQNEEGEWPFGEWYATTIESGVEIKFDDYWFDDTTVLPGACYNYACGCLTYSYGEYKLEAYADGIVFVDCTVPTESTTLSEVKALFR